MVTGIEAAGLALAIFPLVVKGYQEGASMLKVAKNHKRVLRRLVRTLAMENILFENTCRSLLHGMVPANEMARFFDGRGEGWKDDRFQEQLQEKFRPEEVEVFTNAVEELMGCI